MTWNDIFIILSPVYIRQIKNLILFLTMSNKARYNTCIPKKRLYTIKEAAEYLGRPVWGVRELIWSGKIPAIQDGRKQYLDIFDLDRYIERFKKLIFE